MTRVNKDEGKALRAKGRASRMHSFGSELTKFIGRRVYEMIIKLRGVCVCVCVRYLSLAPRSAITLTIIKNPYVELYIL